MIHTSQPYRTDALRIISAPSAKPQQAVLTSWKEIATYLGKGVRTVQRWEARFALPVQRPLNAAHKGVVLARPEDLDAWLRSAWGQRAQSGTSKVGDANGQGTAALLREQIARACELRQKTIELRRELRAEGIKLRMQIRQTALVLSVSLPATVDTAPITEPTPKQSDLHRRSSPAA